MDELSSGLSGKVFAEVFAGTGIVSRRIKTIVKNIIVNDLEYYSYALLKNYIGNNANFNFDDELNELNNLKGEKGFIYKNYCAGSGSGRNYFSDYNGKIIDAVRSKIEMWKTNNLINDGKYYFLLASLLESADKVANTASVYGAFLKAIKKSALVPLVISPALFESSKNLHDVYNQDANYLIKNIEGDILYLDPPYNHRQYGANYHILNTIARYESFIPKGVTGLPEYLRSDYCTKNVYTSLDDLVRNAKFKFIFLSYNNEGILSFDEIKKIFTQYGKYEQRKIEGYQRFKADKDSNRTYSAKSTTEYLHVLIKE